MDDPQEDARVQADKQTEHRDHLLAQTRAIFNDAWTPSDQSGHLEIDIGAVAHRLRHMLEGDRRGG
ncbi:MAG TPA: hypothetical protein VLA19_16555 [Herpetosiphonaceae bacterium]|nr:hypothetical protein [Herpetosiphonaceae bacterium]